MEATPFYLLAVGSGADVCDGAPSARAPEGGAGLDRAAATVSQPQCALPLGLEEPGLVGAVDAVLAQPLGDPRQVDAAALDGIDEGFAFRDRRDRDASPRYVPARRKDDVRRGDDEQPREVPSLVGGKRHGHDGG